MYKCLECDIDIPAMEVLDHEISEHTEEGEKYQGDGQK